MRHTLANGMTVLLQENHAAPVAALQLWVKVGSADELEDEAGLAHLHEHMLFKGTATRGPGVIARTVESCGGHINAWTSFDQTAYHLVLASRFLDEGIDLLADAVTNSAFDAAELAREIEVVCEEIRRSDDSPSRRISRDLFSLAYQTHPYRRPVIGSEESVRSFTREKILAFYHRHYATPNMVFAAVGDFDESVALAAIEKAFAGSRTKAGARTKTRFDEPKQIAPRASVAHAPIHEGHLAMGWHIPSIRAKDVAAIDLLTILLGQGNASRLALEVKRERGLANEIYASAYTPQDPGLLVIGGSLPPEKLKPALVETLRQTYRLRREEFSASELARAKRMTESDVIYQRETVQGQARKLAFFETVAGHVEEEERYLESIATATPEDLRRAAETYLRSENLSIAWLAPDSVSVEAIDELYDIAREAEKSVGATVSTRPPAAYGRLTSAGGTAAKDRGDAGIHVESLSNGVRLVVQEDRTVPLVSFRAAWQGGVRWETAADNGINHLLARSLTRGTEKRSARDFARAIDDLAGSVGGAAGRNSFGARGEFLAADLDKGFDLFAEAMLHPAFDAKEMDRERALVLEDIRSRDDNPQGAVFSLFQATLYDAHPYRLESQGTVESVQALTPDVLRKYRKRYGLSGLTLAVLGDVTVDKARELAFRLGDASDSESPPVIRPDAPLSAPREARRTLDRKQAHLVIGFRGATLASPDRTALEVLVTLLGGQSGRLFTELRDRRSMAYTVTAFSSDGIDPGSTGVYIGTSPEKVVAARTALWEQLDRIGHERVGDDEMERARRHLIGTHEIGLQRLAARSAVMALDEAYGMGAAYHRSYSDRITSVTADDVLRAAQSYFDAGRSVTALVSPE